MAEISFGTYEPATAENPYRETILEMLESDATQGITDSDKGKCMVTIKCKKDEALKIRTQVSNAANEKNRTARIHKNAEPVKDDKGNPTDEVLISFTLNPKHKPRRKGTGKNGPVVITNVNDK